MHDTKSSKTTYAQNAANWLNNLITSLWTPEYSNVRFWRTYFTGFPCFHQCWAALDSQGFFSLLAGVTFSRISLLPLCSDFLAKSWMVCILCLNLGRRHQKTFFAIYAHIVHGIVCKYIPCAWKPLVSHLLCDSGGVWAGLDQIKPLLHTWTRSLCGAASHNVLDTRLTEVNTVISDFWLTFPEGQEILARGSPMSQHTGNTVIPQINNP